VPTGPRGSEADVPDVVPERVQKQIRAHTRHAQVAPERVLGRSHFPPTLQVAPQSPAGQQNLPTDPAQAALPDGP